MLSSLHSRHTGQPHQKGMELGEAWGERRADARKGLRALRGDSMPRIRVHCTRATRNDGQRTAGIRCHVHAGCGGELVDCGVRRSLLIKKFELWQKKYRTLCGYHIRKVRQLQGGVATGHGPCLHTTPTTTTTAAAAAASQSYESLIFY
jgi:hypothetical protein